MIPLRSSILRFNQATHAWPVFCCLFDPVA
jgi:hypothetical protein